eukprot:2376479-Pyramimonas_sp.AAC.1
MREIPDAVSGGDGTQSVMAEADKACTQHVITDAGQPDRKQHLIADADSDGIQPVRTDDGRPESTQH